MAKWQGMEQGTAADRRYGDHRPGPGEGTVHVAAYILLVVATLVGLYAAQGANYLLFHALAEGFSIAVAAAVFMLMWNARRFFRGGVLLWIGTGYLFVAVIDLVHLLAYRGMGVFDITGANTATQLWLAARSLQALVLVTAPWWLRRRPDAYLTSLGFLAVVALVLLSIFEWHIFPTAYDDAAGALTLFKVAAEAVICVVLVGALIGLLRMRDEVAGATLSLLSASVIATLISEISFMLYTDPYGPANLVGHYLKIIAFYLIYKAVVETGLRRPYELLFRDLTQREGELERSQRELLGLTETLEERVAQRTEQLRLMGRELEEMEQRERLRVAGVLHEDVQQALAAARVRIGLAARGCSPETAGELRQATDLLQEAIDTLRRLSAEVSPQVVKDHGFAAALEWLAEHMEARHGLKVELDVDPAAAPTEPEQGELLLRGVRELLFNVVKHARVDHARVTLHRAPDGGCVVTVSDQGAGFDATRMREDRVNGSGLGLATVALRLDLLGGECEFASTPGEGTRVTMILPPSGDGGS